METLTVQMYYNPIKSVVSLNPQLDFSAEITDIIHPEGGTTNHINELSFDIDWKYGVSVNDAPVDDVDISEVFVNHTLYSKKVNFFIVDKYGTSHTLSEANGKYYIRNTNENDIYDCISYRHGKYYVDFFLEYDWELRGIISYIYGTIFDLEAFIEVTNCDIRAKVTTVQKELLTPIAMPENGSVYIGNITGSSENDIGFMGGFL